ncbi:hypothetical protein [Stenomitos frigidus]|uniref:Uncharacterized protein n=1 Tax=Stenomitos frigidus AS-A4 TaxID=2933935 RepID=A0ABV0KND6_9CYAN
MLPRFVQLAHKYGVDRITPFWLVVVAIRTRAIEQCYLDLMTLARKPWLEMLRFERLQSKAMNAQCDRSQ